MHQHEAPQECIVANYSEDDKLCEKEVKLDFGKNGKYEVYTVDEENDGTLSCTTEDPELVIKPFSFVLIKEI